ncbi:MAG TPA: tRNA uridine-5-carboxymethylaminomethyl(34) synthesis GTPase MnmE [Desulfurivibrionaceae bacterium]|nr:tRNA uridine-5-carboxymethylaminomethyl(34) synthesis GTPase MnmE [Desulfurivibrionaceae bacterium]
MAAQHHADREASTIAAIATPPGPGGIGIIRISGSEARPILGRIFRPSRDRELLSHRLTYGWIVDPASGQTLDEVMAVLMAAPHSYTREDVVEIQSHSSYLILQQLLGLVLKVGAIPAEPGEFTKRAFLNGRLDLTRAEAVIDLLQAQTSQGLQIAVSLLRGSLQERVEAVRQQLLSVRALLEVAIDFPDDDLEIINPTLLLPNLADQVIAPLEELLRAADRGRIYREGISVVILGRPNVGKSSLLNSLLKEERAIVTEIPGTTRDTIEDFLNIKGMPVRIVDTAGIRENAEAVEELGIQRARRKQEGADLVLLVVDGADGVQADDLALLGSLAGRPALLVVNKIDLCPARQLEEFSTAAPGLPVVAVSARTGAGLAELEAAIFATVTGSTEAAEPEHYCVPNVRHRQALQGALVSAGQLVAALENGLPPDLAAIEVQAALEQLGEIVGETTSEDLLDAIFSRFCLGK